MATINPSRRFAGSEMSSGDLGRYILPEIPQVTFNKNTNKEGVWLFLLPAYKLDNAGNGVWFKVLRVRDNFGEKFKDKYVVTDASTDPVMHFEKLFRLHYPDQAKVIEVEENGRKMKKYPLFGRTATRVVFNVAYAAGLNQGAFILDLPQFNGADQISKYHETKDIQGREKNLACDPSGAVPMFVKLNDGGGSPWQISFDPSQITKLPDALTDSDVLHNLDSIYVKKDPRELIAKLREMYRPDVFNRCMEGFPGFDAVHVVGERSAPANSGFLNEEETVPQAPRFSAPPAIKEAPALTNVPKSRVPASGGVAPSAPEIPKERVATEGNPMSLSVDEAMEFLKS